VPGHPDTAPAVFCPEAQLIAVTGAGVVPGLTVGLGVDHDEQGDSPSGKDQEKLTDTDSERNAAHDWPFRRWRFHYSTKGLPEGSP
jgi:hypothetical protein